MTNKKKAINISIIVFAISLILVSISWKLKNTIAWLDIIYSLTVGVCGSCLATMAIFIYEYNATKKEIMKSIFTKGVEIQDRIPVFKEYFSDEMEMADYLKGKKYISPLQESFEEDCTEKEKTYYSLCRFVDQMLELGFAKISSFWQTLNEVDFWTDSLIFFDDKHVELNMPYKEYLSQNKNLRIRSRFAPVYWTLTEAPTLNNGYVFHIL